MKLFQRSLFYLEKYKQENNIIYNNNNFKKIILKSNDIEMLKIYKYKKIKIKIYDLKYCCLYYLILNFDYLFSHTQILITMKTILCYK